MLADSVVWANWFVAGGTLTLAAVTFLLVTSTNRSVKTATEELRLERERLTASQTPRVFPAPPVEWIGGFAPYNTRPLHWHNVLPVKNGGPGVALNVIATLTWGSPSGTIVRTVPTSLAPNDSDHLRINWGGEPDTDWASVSGTIIYDDIAGARWQTRFTITTETQNRRFVNVQETTLVSPPQAQE